MQGSSVREPRQEDLAAGKAVFERGSQSGMEPLTSLFVVVSAAVLALVLALVTAVYSIQA